MNRFMVPEPSRTETGSWFSPYRENQNHTRNRSRNRPTRQQIQQAREGLGTLLGAETSFSAKTCARPASGSLKHYDVVSTPPQGGVPRSPSARPQRPLGSLIFLCDSLGVWTDGRQRASAEARASSQATATTEGRRVCIRCARRGLCPAGWGTGQNYLA